MNEQHIKYNAQTLVVGGLPASASTPTIYQWLEIKEATYIKWNKLEASFKILRFELQSISSKYLNYKLVSQALFVCFYKQNTTKYPKILFYGDCDLSQGCN